MKKAFNIIGGSFLIAFAYNEFFLTNDIVPNGIYGIGALITYLTNYDPALFVIITNLLLIIVALLTVGSKKAREYVWPGLLIPLFIFLTSRIADFIIFDSLEKILVVIVGSFLTGLGYSMIYKEGKNVGGTDIIQDILNNLTFYRRKTFSYAVEALVMLSTVLLLGLENMIYSLIVVCVVRTMTIKSKIGVSSSKTFYIITTKVEEIKKYIMEELNHDLTEFDVKGGHSQNKSKILMTAIDTKDYYQLKEGILLIDPKAFISITDGYEVVNKNVSLKKQNLKKKEKKNV